MALGPTWPANPFTPKTTQSFLLNWSVPQTNDPFSPFDFTVVDAFLVANPTYAIIAICLEAGGFAASQPRLHVVVRG